MTRGACDGTLVTGAASAHFLRQRQTYTLPLELPDVRRIPLMLLCLAFLSLSIILPANAKPLPSWRPGAARTAILTFVAAVTDTTSSDFVPRADRIAVLDNDGTCWCEQPQSVSEAFQLSLLRDLVASGRVDGDQMPLRAWLAHDEGALRTFGWSAAYEGLNAAFEGMDVEAYRDSSLAFLGRARDPRFDRPYTRLFYAPMLELKAYLEANGFEVWIVTGGEQAFVRVLYERVVGLAPARVIGTWTTPVYSVVEGKPQLVRGNVRVYNGHEHKPEDISVRIGRRPIFAAGNSDNDEPMCLYAVTGTHHGLAIWIQHDDPDREYALRGHTDKIDALCRRSPTAVPVSMKHDWTCVFP